jgi:hypothetical protein
MLEVPLKAYNVLYYQQNFQLIKNLEINKIGNI